MQIKKLLLASVAAASLGGISSAAQARTDVGVYLNFGPPAAFYEPAPVARLGYVWVPGYWDWRYSRHHWVAGHHVRHRPGHHYYPSRWTHHDGRWRHDHGSWNRDRDRDGIPDHRDRYVGTNYYRNYR